MDSIVEKMTKLDTSFANDFWIFDDIEKISENLRHMWSWPGQRRPINDIDCENQSWCVINQYLFSTTQCNYVSLGNGNCTRIPCISLELFKFSIKCKSSVSFLFVGK